MFKYCDEKYLPVDGIQLLFKAEFLNKHFILKQQAGL
jgi:hypothetical protein